jgi:hypothetical protein
VKVQVNYRSMSTSQGTVRNGDMVDLPTAEVDRINSMKPGALIEIEEAAVFKAAKPKAKTKKRARNKDGTLKGDDPSTPDVNEAWEDG